MKIKFRKFEPTGTFIKLFGLNRDKPDSSSSGVEDDDVYEYYYKRGNTYYFRNSKGDKFSIDYENPQDELVRGNKYKIDTTGNVIKEEGQIGK